MPRRGIKKSFRGEKDGSVISPHTIIQLVVIFVAEVLGTGMLLFIGCMGTIYPIGEYTNENGHLQASLSFGVAVLFIVQIIGHTSASHINPAVTLCALLLGKLRVVTFLIYVVAQIIGALLGVGLLKAVTPYWAWNNTENGHGCCKACLTIPHESMNGGQAFLAEFSITAILIFVVCSVWDKRNGVDPSAPIKFGLAIAGIAIAEGHYTGASMNPARSLAPAIWENNFTRHWVYWVGPIVGSIFATLTYSFLFERDYWKKKKPEEARLTDIKSSVAPHESGEPDD